MLEFGAGSKRWKSRNAMAAIAGLCVFLALAGFACGGSSDDGASTEGESQQEEQEASVAEWKPPYERFQSNFKDAFIPCYYGPIDLRRCRMLIDEQLANGKELLTRLAATAEPGELTGEIKQLELGVRGFLEAAKNQGRYIDAGKKEKAIGFTPYEVSVQRIGQAIAGINDAVPSADLSSF